MSVSNSTNFLSPIGFQFGINKIPNVGFYAQRCNLPGISLPEGTQATPFSDAPVPGDKLVWESFSIDFMVDENMDNYMELWKWLVALGFPNNYEEFIGGPALNHVSDGVLQILSSNNKVTKTIYFQDMFPTSLNTVTFSSTETDVNYIQATADFRYTTFRIE